MRAWALAVVVLACAPALAQAPDGPEFQVNMFPPSDQLEPSIAVQPSGRFVVVWTSWDQFGSGGWVMARRYDRNGVPLSPEFLVSANTQGIGTKHQPAVAYDHSGGFMVVWAAFAPSSNAIFGQRFDPGGARVGGEIRFTATGLPDQFAPRLAAARDGGFLLVWNCASNLFYQICARRLSPTGDPAGDEFQVSTATTGSQFVPDVAREADGGFVVVWESYEAPGSYGDIVGRRYDPELAPRGSEFRVNAATTGPQLNARVAADGRGDFTVVWQSYPQTGVQTEVAARRYSSGSPVGAEFTVNTTNAGHQVEPEVAADEVGNFVVTWDDQRYFSSYQVVGRRFLASGAPRGAEFIANSSTTNRARRPAIAGDPAGNFVLTWDSWPQDSGTFGVYARRYGGLRPAGLQVTGGVNGIVEVPSSFTATPSWRNDSASVLAFQGHVVPGAPPPVLLTIGTDADYGSVGPGATAPCLAPCYAGAVSGVRPPGHVDLALDETIVPDAQGEVKSWPVHVGSSFADVPRASPFYRFVETLLHRGVTGGCTAATYCPVAPATRQEMAVFVLAAREGAGYVPPACDATPLFADVPAGSPFCRWIEELAGRGIVAGCGGGNYCPTAPVTREQMAVFVLRTLDPSSTPTPCASPTLYADVPATSPFCPWIEELTRRGVVGGCGGGNYCPQLETSREQMSAFIAGTFGLTLYGP